jgi:hypothetical protein
MDGGNQSLNPIMFIFQRFPARQPALSIDLYAAAARWEALRYQFAFGWFHILLKL